jgi:hypothetical protein
MTHELTSETLGLYALDALDGAERAAVEQHVQECAACREALAAEYRVLDALARATPQVRPRADLRDRVLGATRPPAAVTPRQGAYTSRAAWFGLAAAATLALVTSVAYVNAQRDLTALRSTLAEWQVRVANAEAQALRAAGAIETQHRMVRVLTSTDLVETALTGLPSSPRTGCHRSRPIASINCGRSSATRRSAAASSPPTQAAADSWSPSSHRWTAFRRPSP